MDTLRIYYHYCVCILQVVRGPSRTCCVVTYHTLDVARRRVMRVYSRERQTYACICRHGTVWTMHITFEVRFGHLRASARARPRPPKNQNSKFFLHLHGDLNLDEIKIALRLLPVNRETNLMNLIRP